MWTKWDIFLVVLLIASWPLTFIIGWDQYKKHHSCPIPTYDYSRTALKTHLATHGEVSAGKYITAADSKLWDLCEKVCNVEMVELCEKYGME
jgi:hypothetical protein